MAKKKHRWHCGHCHGDCVVMKRTKGTKYIFCPNCDRQVAYFNPLPLIPLAVGAALKYGPAAISGAKSLFGGKKKEDKTPTPEGGAPMVMKPSDRYTTEERVHDALAR